MIPPVGTRDLKNEKRPLSRSLCCSGGSDGHGMTGYKFFYLPPKTTVEDAMRFINNYVATGDIGF
jgi:hypothetical protein